MRCKVVCNLKIQQQVGGDTQLSFTPVYSGSEENKLFFKYTPGGLIYLNVVNQEVADRYTVGQEYYIDFFPAS